MLNRHICLDHGSGIVGILATAGWCVCLGWQWRLGWGGGGGGTELWVGSNIMNLVSSFFCIMLHVHYFSRVYTLSVVIYVLVS